MNRRFGALLAVILSCGMGFMSLPAKATSDTDKAALQKATADCRAQVKQYAQYHETSWYARHKMIKSCLKDALAKK